MYPEHNKLQAVQAESQAIGDFLEWLNEQNITLCEWNPTAYRTIGEFQPCYMSIDARLAKYFQIDLVALENEKRQMLEAMRKLHTSNE